MQHDLIGRLRGIDGVAFAPVVADRVGEDATGAIECRGRYGSADLRVPLESVLGVLVPEMEGAVGAGCAESPVHRVEGDGVDAEHVRHVTRRRWCLSMTFEGKVGAKALQERVRLLGGWAEVGKGVESPAVFLLDVLDCATAFDTADCEARPVAEAADHACLPFQRALHGFVEFGGFVEVDDVDVAVRSCHHQQLVYDIHTVDSFLTVDRGHWRSLAQVPILNCLVPGARHEYWGRLARYFNEADAADGLVVRCDLRAYALARAEVEHSRCFICSATDNLGTILRLLLSMGLFLNSDHGTLTLDQQQLKTGCSCS